MAKKTLTGPGLEPETPGLLYQRSSISPIQPFGWWRSQLSVNSLQQFAYYFLYYFVCRQKKLVVWVFNQIWVSYVRECASGSFTVTLTEDAHAQRMESSVTIFNLREDLSTGVSK